MSVESIEFELCVEHYGIPPVLPRKPLVFCFVNAGAGTDWQKVMAIAEDGHCLAQHISSNESWAMHDIGYRRSEWKHETYLEHYPDGCYLRWIEDPRHHRGLDAAYQLNQAMRVEEPSHGTP